MVVEKFEWTVFAFCATERITPLFGGSFMKKSVLKTIAATLTAWAMAHACADDIPVNIPPELGGISYTNCTHKEADDVRSRHQAALGARYSEFAYIASSMGQLVKACDWAGVVEIVNIVAPKETSSNQCLKITFKPESTLFGDKRVEEFTCYTEWWDLSAFLRDSRLLLEGAFIAEWYRRPKQGDRLLIFLTSLDYDRLLMPKEFIALRFDFMPNRVLPANQKSPLKIIRGGGFGTRQFDDKKTEDAFLDAARGYFRVLRERERVPEDYYELLRSLARSPIPRIREDARSDMVIFLRFTSFDLTRVMNDESVDEGIKTYIRTILLPDRDKNQQ
jgi:hypothetical protein